MAPADAFDRSKLIIAMGGSAEAHAAPAPAEHLTAIDAKLRVESRPKAAMRRIGAARPGWRDHRPRGPCRTGAIGDARRNLRCGDPRRMRHEVDGAAAFVAGDRQTDGVFPLWSIAENITICSLGQLSQGFFNLSASRGGPCAKLAATDRHPYAGSAEQHPVALRRQPAEGAVCPCSGLECRDHSDGRSDAGRRYQHQARSLRDHPARRPGADAPSSGTQPKWTSSNIATASIFSATARSSASLTAMS